MTNNEYRAKLLTMDIEEFAAEVTRAFEFRRLTPARLYRNKLTVLWVVAKYKGGDYQNVYITAYIHYLWGATFERIATVGVIFATLLTWNPDQGGWSMFWATIHGYFSWFYVILHSFGVR